MEKIVLIAFATGIVALIFAWTKSVWINKQDPGTERMQELGLAIREGAMAFLYREYKVLAIFVVAVAALLFFGYTGSLRLIAVAFVFGAICSALAGFCRSW